MKLHKLRISKLGAQAIKTLATGRSGNIQSTRYLNASCSKIRTLRQLRAQGPRYIWTIAAKDGNEEQTINVTFVEIDGTEKLVKVPVGTTMLEAAHSNGIEIEGACEGYCACSTCHVIVTDVDYYNKLPDPSEDESDMLALALGVTDTSRLGCQIEAKREIDGIRLALPEATRNLTVLFI